MTGTAASDKRPAQHHPATMTAVKTPAPGRDPLDAAARKDLRELFAVEALHRRGPGSMVYIARDLEDDQRIALKVMPRSPAAAAAAEDAFQRAAATVAALRHVHVVPLHRSGATRHFFWYTMEYVEAPSLADVLREKGPMELLPCLRVVEQIGSALDYAHRRGVVHANLKPSNVLLDGAGWARVSDFSVPGVLERLGALGASGGGRVRQPAYVAPDESSQRQPGPHADQYALAALVYESLGGTIPASAPEVVPQPLPLLCDADPRIPRHMAVAVQRALSGTPGARFASIVEFVAALQAPAASAAPEASQPVSSRVPRLPVVLLIPPERAPITKRRWASLSALTLAAAGAAVAVALPRSGRSTAGTIVESRGPTPTATATVDPAAAPAPAPPLASGAPPGRVFVNAIPWDWLFGDRGPVGNTEKVASKTQKVASNPQKVASNAQKVATNTRKVASNPQKVAIPVTPRTPSAAQPGRLFVNATPWGRLFVDGVLVGNTPKGAIPVTPGTHLVRVVRDGFAPFQAAVRVESGQDLRLTDIVLAALEQ